MSFGEAVEALGASTGRVLRYVDLPPEQWREGAVGAGIPHDYADLLVALQAMIRDGHDAGLSSGTQDVLGRPATSLGEVLAREAANAVEHEPAHPV